MKHLAFRSIIVALVLLVTFATPASAQSLNRFTIPSYTIDYVLDRTDQGRSLLKVKETIVAEFVYEFENRGIERAIPKQFDDRPLKMTDLEVVNENGEDREYTVYDDEDDNQVIRIGDPDEYVIGTQTYVLSYTLNDVTKYFEDNGRDEWYWNTNGTGWRVPIDALTVNITLEDGLESALIQEPICYWGAKGAAYRCTLEKKSATQYTVTETDLRIGQNISVAYGFSPETFAPHAFTPIEWITRAFESYTALKIATAAIIGAVFSSIYGYRANRRSERSFAPAQYIPPKDTTVLASGILVRAKGSSFSAQLLDWAVRHYIAIYEVGKKSFFSKRDYDIEIKKDVSHLKEEEKELLRDLFGGTLPKVGDRLSLKTLVGNRTFTMAVQNNTTKINRLIRKDYLLREEKPENATFILYIAGGVFILGLVTFALPLLILSLFILSSKAFFHPLTEKGLELARYLDGYKKYIKASEKDRLAMLQGPDTAEKIGRNIDTSDPAQLVKLYERSLPYAVLFKFDKKWSAQLGALYEQSAHTPTWYHSTGAFHYAGFATAVHTFSTTSASYGGSGGSGSGSSGGGSSGGGGGGGGGGGW